LGRADGGAGQEDEVTLDEGSRLDRIPGTLNFVGGPRDIEDDRLWLGLHEIEAQTYEEKRVRTWDSACPY
jgi:hypothetical protein